MDATVDVDVQNEEVGRRHVGGPQLPHQQHRVAETTSPLSRRCWPTGSRQRQPPGRTGETALMGGNPWESHNVDTSTPTPTSASQCGGTTLARPPEEKEELLGFQEL